jgi:hypothetical protein
MVTGEECPPDSALEFQENCRATQLASIVDGKLLGSY